VRTTVVYTLLVAENESDDEQIRGERLPGRPLHDLAYQAGWRAGPLDLEYRLDFVAGLNVDVGGHVELPARLLHGAAAALDVPGVRGLRASVQIDNLLDVRTLYVDSPLSGRRSFRAVPVSDFLGFPLPGRTVWASIGYRVPQ
jgi:outer membrane receptor protein involved in Fe transport